MEDQARLDRTERHAAREEFFRIIKRENADVVLTLAEQVLPAYEAIYDAGLADGIGITQSPARLLLISPPPPGWSLVLYPGSFCLANDNLAIVIRLKDALNDWATKYYLTDDWCLGKALVTLDYWLHSQSREDLDWHYEQDDLEFDSLQKWIQSATPDDGEFYIDYLAPIKKLELVFKFPPWFSEDEHPHHYRDRVRETFEEHLSDYLRQMERAAREAARPIARKLPPQNHFEWLVAFQTKGLNFSEIAKAYGSSGTDHGTVSKAINNLAQLLGLTHRPARPGRPKKSSRL